MDLYPAIDLRDGKCVRLYQGDYGRETIYGDDPVAQAEMFADAGARWIHIVDLDAARTGEPWNRSVVIDVANSVTLRVQTGGGIRTAEAAESLLEAGVARVVVGTAAIENPGIIDHLVAGERSVALAVDVRGREVAVRGWEAGSGRDVLDVVADFAGRGVEAFIVTQIARDGTLEGPDVEGLELVLGASGGTDVIASGGVGTLDDLRALAGVEVGDSRLAGVIVGRAFYEGAFTVDQALYTLADA